jgi:serine phosphatase RsbU (regulator of sigma subunit)
MEARENEERLRRLKWVAAGLLAFVGFIFLAIYTYIRHLQMKRLKEAYDKLEETTAAKERIESELRIARSIQMAMVPHEFPESKRLNIYASMTPAKEVGGDLYDFVVIGDKLYFCLGDVSGKGVPAALFMAMSIRLFRTLCKYQLKPAEIAMSMNNELALNNENGMFVTMFIGPLDLTSGRLDFCNAGHNPPVLNGNFINMEPNAPLGLWEGLDYEGETLENIRGKQFFVYSDGLNEAENDAQDQYSDDRLLNFLKGHTDMAAHPLIDLLMEDVEHHVDGAGPSDDMTMLCLRMK